MQTIRAGHPDYAKYGTVMADRTTLSIKLRRALGYRHDFLEIDRALALYGPTLRFADPAFGTVPSEDAIKAMRDAEQKLYRCILAKAGQDWCWRLFGHERTK